MIGIAPEEIAAIKTDREPRTITADVLPPDDSPAKRGRRDPLPPMWIDWAAVAEVQAARRALGLDKRLPSLTPFVRYGDPNAKHPGDEAS